MERHPSLDDRLDPAVRIAASDASWPELAAAECRLLFERELGERSPGGRLASVEGTHAHVAALEGRARAWPGPVTG